MTILCGESTADGVNYFLAEDEKAAMFYARVTDIICGAPGEVDHWGGWKTDMTIKDLEEDGFEFTESVTIEMLIAAALKEGAKPATVVDCKKLLVEDSPDMPGGSFQAWDAWAKYLDE